MILRSPVILTLALVGAMAVSGCARQISSDVYSGGQIGEAISTSRGVVEAARPVALQEEDRVRDNGLGALIGGIAGGFAGATVGEGLGKAAAITAGAIIGSAIGSAVERDATNQNAMEYVVRLSERRSGEENLVTIVQGPKPELRPGDAVYVQIGNRGRGRVIPRD